MALSLRAGLNKATNEVLYASPQVTADLRHRKTSAARSSTVSTQPRPEAALVVGARISQSANQNVGSFVSVCRGPTPLLASWRESKLAVIGDCDQAGP
jgi:hypothetical protein